LELANDLAAIAGVERRLHHRALSFFVRCVDREQSLPQAAGSQHARIKLTESLPRLLGPFDISVVGEKLAAVKLRHTLAGRSARCRSMQRRLGRRFESLSVDDELVTGRE